MKVRVVPGTCSIGMFLWFTSGFILSFGRFFSLPFLNFAVVVRIGPTALAVKVVDQDFVSVIIRHFIPGLHVSMFFGWDERNRADY